MDGILVMCWAVFITLWIDFPLWTEQLPYQGLKLSNRILSVVHMYPGFHCESAEEEELFHVTLYLWTSVLAQHLHHHLQERPETSALSPTYNLSLLVK